MTAHILRLDLSQGATDFEPTALEPGVPMIDGSGDNYSILRHWFGTVIAEPVKLGADELHYYIRDDKGSRLAQATCLPATQEDLVGSCRAQVDKLRERLQAVKPASTAEHALLRAARAALIDLSATDKDGSYEGCFVKYREASEPWQLAWCWGYRRKDRRPAAAELCTNQGCKQLFLRAPSEKIKCPGCTSAAVARDDGARARRNMAVTATTAALIALGLFFVGRASVGLSPLHGKGAEEVDAAPHAGDALSADFAHKPINGVTDKPLDLPVDQATDTREKETANGDDKHIAADAASMSRETSPKVEASENQEAAPSLVSGSNTQIGVRPSVTTTPIGSTTKATSNTALPHVAVSGVTPAVTSVIGATVKRGAYVGNGLAVLDDRVVVGDWPVGSILHGSSLVPGTVILGVNGVSYLTPDVVTVGSLIQAHPITAGDIVEYRTPQGTVEKTVLSDATGHAEIAALCEVKLIGVRADRLSPRDFQPLIDLELTRRAEYRLVDNQGRALSEWSELGPLVSATLVGRSIQRAPGDEYELFVERRRGIELRRFQVAFKLSASAT